MQPDEAESATRLWVVLARAHHAVAAYMEQSIASLGIGLTDFAVLEVLLHKGPLSMREVGNKVLLANASTTSAIDRLEARGLVRRSATTGDRRVRLAELTAEGRALARRLFAQHEQDIQALMRTLPPETRERLRNDLKHIGLRAAELLAAKKNTRSRSA